MKKIVISFLVITPLFLVGCATTFTLMDANEQLNSYYSSLEQAKTTKDYTMEVTALSMLADLATTTAQEAEKSKTALNKISLYRVAATAAWKAEETSVVAYSNAGVKVCEKEWNNAPRDCGMLTFIKDLASIDETTRLFNIETLKTNTQINDQVALDIFNRYEATATDMIRMHTHLLESVPESLLTEFDKRLSTLICKHISQGASGLLARAQVELNTACRVENLRIQANNANIKLTGCLGPIPEQISNC
ncbi:hypothetical protein [Aliiglaciecola lipolytica]|uniref:Lipoprotein n=1 Tax=Aliiglaciecola lipolytica E3 TaxID=1127673 RepID=K6YB48_9ALTE|nr:hypothetical protein [Aliiglaciecola lipolytica]GAC13858.1 hypothetical protein GLIP_1217 [Aliiglaciecola lipolytica E3]